MTDETQDIAATRPQRPREEAPSLARLMVEGLLEMAGYYAREMSRPEAMARARAVDGDDVERAEHAPPAELTWWTLGRVTERDPERGLAIWKRVLDTARDELHSGHRSADAAVLSGSPWERAQYLALLEALVAELQPANVAEVMLVESVAEARWNQVRWTVRLTALTNDMLERPAPGKQKGGRPPLPRLDVAAAIDQAARMVEQFSKQVDRSLRSLHDLRATPASLTVRDVGQLNVAQRQLNVIPTEPNLQTANTTPQALDGSSEVRQEGMNRSLAAGSDRKRSPKPKPR